MAGALEKSVANYEKAAEEVANAAALAMLNGRKFTNRKARALCDRLQLGELNGARAERRVLDMRHAKAKEDAAKRLARLGQ